MSKQKSSKARLVKEPLQLYADPKAADALRALSERTRVPMQVYLREGLDLVLAKHKFKDTTFYIPADVIEMGSNRIKGAKK